MALSLKVNIGFGLHQSGLPRFMFNKLQVVGRRSAGYLGRMLSERMAVQSGRAACREIVISPV